MATYNFSDYAGQTITGFDVDADVLAFDTLAVGPASRVTFNTTGTDLVLRAANGQTVTLAGVSILEITTTNVTFADASTLAIGDDSTDVFGDAGNNGALADSGNSSSNIWGFEGDDTVAIDGNGANYVQGHAGDDGITVNGDGANIIRGGSGVDTILVANTASGDNVVFGDVGDDDIDVAGTGANTVYGGADADDINLNATATGDNVVRGGSGDDTLTITNGANGNNTVWGDLGDDTINLSGTGNNTVYGDNPKNLTQEGNDTLNFGATAAGDNLFNGMGGDDIVNVTLVAAHAGDNTLRGGADADTFNIADTTTATGSFLLKGDKGDDTFNLTLNSAAQDNITAEGGEGDDEFNLIAEGFAHNVTLTGGAGNDTFNVDVDGSGSTTRITDFASGDAIELTSVTAVDITVSHAAGQTQLDLNGDTLQLAAYTGALNATNFTLADNTVLIDNYGGAAATLTGSANDDQLIAGNNGDRLISAGGNDKLVGGNGADTFVFTGAEAAALSGTTATIAGGSGTDTLELITSGGTVNAGDFAKIGGVERVLLNADVGTWNVTTSADINWISAAAVTTGTNNTTLNVAAGTAVTVLGGAGVDTVTLGAGANNVSLGAGADDLTLGSTTIGTLAGGAGVDTLTDLGGTVTLSGTNVSSFEAIELDTGNGDIAITIGSGYQATLEASTDLTVTNNGGGDDISFDASVLTSAVGLNFTGDTGADTVKGGADVDTIVGGDGADVLTGNGGADLFRYLADTEGDDEITDFTAGASGDVIGLDTSAFGAGGLLDTNFVKGNEAAVIASAANDTIFVITDGTGYADFAAVQTVIQAANPGTADYLVAFFNTTSGAVEVYFDDDSSAGVGAGAGVLLATLSNLDDVSDVATLVAANFDTF